MASSYILETSTSTPFRRGVDAAVGASVGRSRSAPTADEARRSSTARGDLPLVTGLSQPQPALYLEQALEDRLGIPDRTVTGERKLSWRRRQA